MPDAEKTAAIVPVRRSLTWASASGREATPPAPKTQQITGRVLAHGEMRATTREEATAARYGLDASDHYQRRTIDQLNAVDHAVEAWEAHKRERIERGTITDAKSAEVAVTADLTNAGKLLANFFFGD